MTSLISRLRRISKPGALSPQDRSTRRMAVVAATVLASIGVLALATVQARRAESALDQATSQTLRDYTGYAGRLMGSEVLRRFADQRSRVLAPVTGTSGRDIPAPELSEIVTRGNRYNTEFGPASDPRRAYFRLDLGTGKVETEGPMNGVFASRVSDTLLAIVATTAAGIEPSVLVLEDSGVARTVTFARLLDSHDRAIAIYGYTYTRAIAVAATADRVFADTPLLPTSFAGARWNYDTTSVRAGEVANDSLLGVRITDRVGRVLWQSSSVASAANSPYRQRAVLSTSAGGIVVESALRPAGEPMLIPGIVRRAQRSSLGALIALTLLLAAVSLYALGRERRGAQARRAEGMQQLALGLRHELNNALASVMLNAELLSEDSRLDAAQRNNLDAVIEQADRMRTVLRRLEQADRLNVVVPYLNEGYMVDLSAGELPRAG